MSYGWRTIDGDAVELCDECGFDARTVTDDAADLADVFTSLELLLDHPEAERRPAPETWSAREYVDHCREVTQALLEYVARVLAAEPPGDLPDLPTAATACARVVPALTSADRAGVLEGEYPIPVTVDWIVLHLLHDLEHHVLDIRRGYAGLALKDHPEVHTVQR
jgi:hypothetical protein